MSLMSTVKLKEYLVKSGNQNMSDDIEEVHSSAIYMRGPCGKVIAFPFTETDSLFEESTT
jgi:hypothetical protein